MSNHTKAACPYTDCGGMCQYCCCFICARCGLGEGCLTTDCPGADRPNEPIADKIYDGKLDYRGGKWVEECSPSSPAYRIIEKEKK